MDGAEPGAVAGHDEVEPEIPREPFGVVPHGVAGGTAVERHRVLVVVSGLDGNDEREPVADAAGVVSRTLGYETLVLAEAPPPR